MRGGETEALTRWHDSQHGFISPADFITILEQYRDIHKLDICTVRQVCADLRRRMLQGLPILPVSINLSRLDFELCDIFQEVERALKESGVSKEMLKIEITESVHGEDLNVLNLGIEKFRQNGYEVWMDDFGSGYSSLNVLKDYNFDTIKFDMKFLSDFGKSEKSRFILSSNLSMAKQMGIQSLAEGVETQEQLDYLKSIGFEKAQGYLFGRPMPMDEIFALPRPKEDYRDTPYYERLGRVELLNQDLMLRMGRLIADVRAMALVEYREGELTLLAENDMYREWLGSGIVLRERLLEAAERLRGPGDEDSFYAFMCGNCAHVEVIFIASNPRTRARAYLVTHTSITRFPPSESPDRRCLLGLLPALSGAGDVVELEEPITLN